MRSTEASSTFGSQGRSQTAIPVTTDSTAIPAAIAALGWGRLARILGREPHPVNPDRLDYVLDLLRTHALEGQVELGLDALVNDVGDADAARLRQPFQARGNVHAVTVDIITLDNDVAKVDTDPKRQLLALRQTGAARRVRPLDSHGAGDGVNDTGELDQRAVAHKLDDAAIVARDLRIDDLAAQRLEARERVGLVGTHEPGITDNVRGQDRSQATLHACSSFVGRLAAGRSKIHVVREGRNVYFWHKDEAATAAMVLVAGGAC